MSLSKPRHKPSHDFPEDILSEIFKRLPVKYVLRCGAVQKSWYSLVRTPMFISLHCNYQKMTAHINPKYLQFFNSRTDLSTIRSDDAQSQEYCTFSYVLDLPPCLWSAQSNGLICESNMFDEEDMFDEEVDNPEIHIWNPLVDKFRIVPDSPLPRFTSEETKWKALAFGFSPEDNDYVVVHVVKPSSTCAPDDAPHDEEYKQYPHTVIIGVYSLKTNSWKKICQDKVFVDYMSSKGTNESVFVNGTAFWAGYNSDEICQLVMYFDTNTNIMGQVNVPGLEDYPLILPYGRSIAYFVKDNEVVDSEDEDYGSDWDTGDTEDDDYRYTTYLGIWVLKDEMINELSWEKNMSLSWEDRMCLSWEKKMKLRLSKNVLADVLGTRNSGEPILAKLNNLISYDLDTHKPYDFVESCDRLTLNYHHNEASQSPFVIRPFVETLVLFDVD